MFGNNRSQSSGERSAEDRRRAREERERRRAGKPPIEPPVTVVAAPKPEPDEPEVQPRAPEPVAEPPVEHDVPTRELEIEHPADEVEHRADEVELPADEIDPPADEPDIKAAIRPKAKRSTPARAGALLALLAAIFLVWFLLSLFQPGAGGGHGRVIVNIPRGSSAGTIGSILQHEGVVSSGFFFGARALINGKRGSLHSGTFAMRHDMSYSAAIEVLSAPPPAVIAVKVVIPEGETRLQIAQLAHADGLTGSYLQASKRSPALDPTRYGAPRDTPNLEGFLFPATYELRAGIPAARLVTDQLQAFQARFGAQEIHRAHVLHVTPYAMLTVASMIEREAEIERDRPLVAAVIYNRLRQGIPLGIDATIRYALNDYSAPLTEAQLRMPSPYNTRLHRGLPPTPISNPGMASIEAAAHPAHVSYLYYVAGADGCGEQVFSTSYAQFEKNAAAYREAVRKNGGRVPTCKK